MGPFLAMLILYGPFSNMVTDISSSCSITYYPMFIIGIHPVCTVNPYHIRVVVVSAGVGGMTGPLVGLPAYWLKHAKINHYNTI